MKRAKQMLVSLPLLASLGCGYLSDTLTTTKADENKPYELVRGKPLGVAATTRQYGDGDLSVILQIEGEKEPFYILGSVRGATEKLAEAEALINSEINDGDDEKVELSGYYIRMFAQLYERFDIREIHANGITIRLGEEKEF